MILPFQKVYKQLWQKAKSHNTYHQCSFLDSHKNKNVSAKAIPSNDVFHPECIFSVNLSTVVV